VAPVQSKGAVRAFRAVGRVAAVVAMLSATGCQTLGSVKDTFLGGSDATKEPDRLTGFIGAVVADEPRAALAGREVLALGGSAGDAAVAIGLMLAVTLPSRAGLGGGGACIAYNPSRDGPGGGNAEAIVFTPGTPATTVPGTDRQAAIPMMARGLFALHARYGKRPFESLVAPAEQAARFGVPVSRALLRDLAVVAGPLAADPNARAVFAPGGAFLSEGSTLVQPELGATLSQLRTAGVGDLYVGALGRRLEQASRLAGGGLTIADMRGALPRTGAPLTIRAGRDLVAFTPPPADGGLAAAAAFQVLQAGGDAGTAQARALGAATRWRQGGGDPVAVLASGASSAGVPILPASAGYVVLDRDGNSVACTVTMNNLFGTGRIAPGTGILLGKAVPQDQAPLLAAFIAWNPNVRGFRAAVTGTGQEGAALAAAAALSNAIKTNAAMPAAVPEPGRANVIACSRYLPDSEGSCSWATDPRGPGLAVAGN
jgi:gamma-glutamyltranspeptidase/glutathione hydrolase